MHLFESDHLAGESQYKNVLYHLSLQPVLLVQAWGLRFPYLALPLELLDFCSYMFFLSQRLSMAWNLHRVIVFGVNCVFNSIGQANFPIRTNENVFKL